MSDETLFHEARQKPLGERTAFLQEACGDDDALRARLESLLQADDNPDSLLEPKLPDTSAISSFSGAAGQVLGPYKLLQQIGEGGMGTVFLAQQTKPIKRIVALKIIKASVNSGQVTARFEAERQALALMDHPNIAKMLDAGTTDSGRQYFVMELVKGIPIIQYCDDHRLTPPQRLELFISVCQAVQHAHQKGIIHRDLKPTNILVADYDEQPVAKIIDFGVAKAVGQELTQRTLFTEFGQVLGTIEYMSPEQAKLNQIDIDTRTDIYSLGVILYELLSGETPFDRERLQSAAFDEMLRIIREEEPPKPSTRLSSSDSLPSIAANRQQEPRKLTATVSGELDWIVMKSLEKDRTRRYATANGLAMDLSRYLSDEPVEACPPSVRYRFGKFARRHRRSIVATAAAFVGLLAMVAGLLVSNGIIISERNATAAALADVETQRQRAETNLLKARTAVAAILAKPATAMDEWSQLSPTLRRKFEDEATKYYQGLLQDESNDQSLRYETAVGYRSLGYLNYKANDYQQSEKLYEKSIVILESLVSAFPENFEYQHQLAYSLMMLGDTLMAMNQMVNADTALKRATGLYEKLFLLKPNDPDYPIELPNCYRRLLEVARDQRPLPEQQAVCQRVVDGLAKLPSESMEGADVRAVLGEKLLKLNRPAEAESLIRNALAIYQRQPATSLTKDARTQLGHLLWQFGDVQLATAHKDEGRKSYEQGLKCFEALAVDYPNERFYRQEVAFSHRKLSDAYAASDDLPQATADLRQAIQGYEGLIAEVPESFFYMQEAQYSYIQLANRLKDNQETQPAIDACVHADELLQPMLKACKNPNDTWTAGVHSEWLGQTWRELGRLDEAEQTLLTVVDLWTKLVDSTKIEDHRFHLGRSYEALGHIYKARHHIEKTIETYRQALEIWTKPVAEVNDPDRRIHLFWTEEWMIDLLLAQARQTDSAAEPGGNERQAKALELREQAANLLRGAIENRPQTAESANAIAWWFVTNPELNTRDLQSALALAKQAVAIEPKNGSFWNTLGGMQYRAGNWQAAVTALNKSMELRHGGDSSDWLFLAMGHWQLNEKEDARTWYDKAVAWMDKNQPKNDELVRFRGEAETLMNGKAAADAKTEKRD